MTKRKLSSESCEEVRLIRREPEPQRRRRLVELGARFGTDVATVVENYNKSFRGKQKCSIIFERALLKVCAWKTSLVVLLENTENDGSVVCAVVDEQGTRVDIVVGTGSAWNFVVQANNHLWVHDKSRAVLTRRSTLDDKKLTFENVKHFEVLAEDSGILQSSDEKLYLMPENYLLTEDVHSFQIISNAKTVVYRSSTVLTRLWATQATLFPTRSRIVTPKEVAEFRVDANYAYFRCSKWATWQWNPLTAQTKQIGGNFDLRICDSTPHTLLDAKDYSSSVDMIAPGGWHFVVPRKWPAIRRRYVMIENMCLSSGELVVIVESRGVFVLNLVDFTATKIPTRHTSGRTMIAGQDQHLWITNNRRCSLFTE